jgi:hypothetical protein
VTPEIEKHLSANGNMRRRTIIVNNFLGGLAWGFGTVIGATVVVAILITLAKNFTFIPFINDLGRSYQQVKQESMPQQTIYRTQP